MAKPVDFGTRQPPAGLSFTRQTSHSRLCHHTLFSGAEILVAIFDVSPTNTPMVEIWIARPGQINPLFQRVVKDDADPPDSKR